MKIITTVLLGVLLGFPGFSVAQDFSGAGSSDGGPSSFEDVSQEAQQFSAPVYFRLGKSKIDPDFMGNHERIERFIASLQRILSNPDYVISKVKVVGMASPDGSRLRNEELAGARAEALASLLMQRTSITSDKIEVVNGGENWDGLFAMIEAAEDMPDKDKMLELRDRYGEDRDQLKRTMQSYNGSRAWKYMYQHFFPILRTGAGGAAGDRKLSDLSVTNWQQMREIVQTSNMDKATQDAMLDIISQVETERKTDAVSVMRQLREISSDSIVYERLERQVVDGLLSGTSTLSTDNWTQLRELAASSDMPAKEKVLDIIDRTPVAKREESLRKLEEGEPYEYIVKNFYPQLLRSDRLTEVSKAPDAEADPTISGVSEEYMTVPLGEENWKKLRAMIASSDMPDKEAVLSIIDTKHDPASRERDLQALNDGYPYRYIQEVFFPELLYGLSDASKENWQLFENIVNESDLSNKAKVQKIIRTTPPGVVREQAIRALDDGKTWNEVGRLLLPELLQNSEDVDVEASGTGMSVTFEASPAAKARAAELKRQQEEKLRREEEARLAEERRQEELRKAEERRRQEELRRLEAEKAREAARQAAIARRRMEPVIALKTDFVLWGSLMPGFEMGSFTPNLSVEAFFARRWSVQLGGAYSNWDALGGDYGLYAATAVDLEPRWWLKNDGLFRGFFAGVYAAYGDFDLQKKDEPKGTTGTYFMGGVSAGWSQVLGRHLFLEAGLRLGYRSADGEHYTMLNGHDYTDGKESLGKFAPQIRLQLVYRFGKSGKSVK